MAFMACCTALSASAVEVGDKVLTPQGRFLIQGDDECTNGTFAKGFAGWTANAGEGVGFDQIFTYNGEGIVSQNAANTSGMYYSFMPTTGRSYVVSITMTQAEPTTPNQATRTSTGTVTSATNFVQVHMNGSTEEPGTPAGTVNRVNAGEASEIIPGEPITLNFALVGDEIDGRTAFIEFIGMNTNITINKVEIHQAVQLGYSRDLQPTIDYAKTILNCYDWSTVDDPDELVASLQELIGAAEDVVAKDKASQDDVDSALADLQGGITVFCKGLMDDYLPDAKYDKIPMSTVKVQKWSAIGVWKDGIKRIHAGGNETNASNPAYYDLGHYQNGATWGGGTGKLSLSCEKELVPGTYVFSVSLRAAAREDVKGTWTNNDGLSFAEGELYFEKKIVDVVEDENGQPKENITYEKVATTNTYPLNPLYFVKKTLVADIQEAGTYRITMMTTPKPEYASLMYGSVAYPFEASLYAKTAAAYNQAQLAYEEDVRGQIKAATDAIEKAKGYIADEAKSWGKEELSEAVNVAEEAVAPYVAMDQDAIIETYDAEIYNSSKPLTGDDALDQDGNPYRMLAYKVYQNAVNGILRANEAFEAQNAHIDNLTAAIKSAKEIQGMRIYSLSEGADALKTAIENSEAKDTELRAADYSEENALAADDAVAALNEAVVEFQNGVPAECFTTLVDIDFSNAAVQDPETKEWTITGNVGQMNLGKAYTPLMNAEGAANTEDNNYTQGFYTNETAFYTDMLRIGNNDATVAIPGDLAKDTEMLQISFDYYYGNLNGRYAAWKVQSAQYDEETGVTSYKDELGLNCSKYDGKDDFNTFGIDYNGKINGVGSRSAQNDLIAAEGNKTTVTMSIDLWNMTATCTTAGSMGTVTWNEATLSAVPTRFLIGSNYNVAARRCWFDNLVISTVKTTGVKGVADVNAAAPAKVAKKLVNGQVLIETVNGTFTAAGAQVK